MNHSYKTIVEKAETVKKNVETSYKLGASPKWVYYFAKAIMNPKKDIQRVEFKEAPKPTGKPISRQLSKSTYLDLAKQLIKFVEHHKRLPNYLSWNGYRIRCRVYVYMFAKVLVYYNKHDKLPLEVDVNYKAFYKPTETGNNVYDYFVKIFGKFDNTIDGALSKVVDTGYGSYYDDQKTNKETIDSMKSKNQSNKPNCTDSCHVFFNIMLQLIKMGKYRKIECLHVNCSSGGHVKLRITKNNGDTFIRDPAAVISRNGKGLTANWCINTPKAVNPAWFMSNLNR